MAVTLRDIAKRLNLSHATVSFVLNERHDVAIPDSTRQRVIETAREMGYRPNRAARALVMGRTQMLALWMPSIRSPYYAQVFDALHASCRSAGYEILYCESEASSARPGEWPVDGVIAVDIPDVLASMPPVGSPPAVSIGTLVDPKVDHVQIDVQSGTVEAVMHLIDSGCRRIAHITTADPLSVHNGRGSTYTKVISSAGRRSELILCPSGNQASVRACIREYITKHDAPDGMFCFNDETAIATLRALSDLDIEVPGKCRVIGFDGIPETEFLTPSLSTVVQPISEMCHRALEMLQRRLANDQMPPQAAVLPSTLKLRESSATGRGGYLSP